MASRRVASILFGLSWLPRLFVDGRDNRHKNNGVKLFWSSIYLSPLYIGMNIYFSVSYPIHIEDVPIASDVFY